MSEVALRLAGITKTFGTTVALQDVDLEVAVGEVHGLVGENGAGKSTLMGVAAGSLSPDHGEVEIAGHVLGSASAARAQELGIAVVYQNPAVVADLTVLENLVLAVPSPRREDGDDTRAWAARWLETVGLDLDLDARATELRTAERQLLEIAKALAQQPRVLVLDEPTESLTSDQVDRLFGLIAELVESGTAVVYISHRIAEVRRVAHCITTLRDGRVRGTAPTATLTDDDIVTMVVGRALSAVFPPKNATTGDDRVVVGELGGPGFRDVSLTCAQGQVVGLAGVEGNGQRAFLRALAGLNPPDSGTVRIDGDPVDLSRPGRATSAGVAYIAGDRAVEGLFPALSVRENMTVGHLGALGSGGIVSPRLERAAVTTGMTATAVRAASTDAPIGTLSGGNQQKVLFARAIMTEPRLLLCDEPTRGVDVGARREIYDLLRERADDGSTVVVLSSDAAELAGLCDEVVVFSGGRAVQTLRGDEVTEEKITGSALRAVRDRPTDDPTSTDRGRGRGARMRRSDSLPGAVLLLLAVVLAAVTTVRSPTFLGELNVQSLLIASAALGLVALGQLTVVMTGGIDLSAGPVVGLTVVVLSYTATDGGAGGAAVGVVIALAVAAGVGLLNGLLVLGLQLPPIVATLATFVAVQGVSLLLRDTPGGLIEPALMSSVISAVGPVPLLFVVLIVLAVLLERVLRNPTGMALRAAGSDPGAAARLGVPLGRTVLGAYVVSSVLAGLGGVVVAGQIGIGDPTQGVTYTLSSITVVVLAGASVYGGRGSYLGIVPGAILLAMLSNASNFLGLNQAWQFWLPGGLVLVATAIAFRTRPTPPQSS
ncbi:MAG: ATP-binding cassette domain-containing protein [Nocardioidaceae bacterium]|nr:ATP-binding cassette domain-containing protein [Nocardioidaceae bacterium]